MSGKSEVRSATSIEDQPLDAIWWRDPWWEDPLYQEEYSLTLSQIQPVVESLKSIFDETWMRRAIDAPPPNAIVPILCGGRGLWPFETLMWLGQIVQPLVRLSSVHRPLRDLIGSKSRSALFEMETASWLAESGLDVEFLKPSSEKTPDLRVSAPGLLTSVECKYFNAEQWENWVDALHFEIMRLLSRQNLTGLPSYEIVFEPRLPDIVWSDDAIRKTIQQRIAEQLCEAIKRAFEATPPDQVQIHGVGIVCPRPELPDSQIMVGGIQVSPQGKTRRIITNGVLEAAEQLRGWGPGAVVINAHFTPPESLLDLALHAINRADPSTLAAVSVVVVTGFARSPPVIWLNPEIQGHDTNVLAKTFRSALLTPRRLIRT